MNTSTTFIDQYRRFRRKRIKRVGKYFLHKLSGFINRQSLIGSQPVFKKAIFPWITEFENHWEEIRSELDLVLKSPDDLPCFHELSPDQKRISKGSNWKTFVFYCFSTRVDKNCNHCPTTAGLLDQIPDIENAWFSILAPHYHIPPHKGPTNGIIRIHLGLMTPEDRNSCYIRIGNEILHWDEGKCIVFDDYHEHEVWNDTDEWRAVLFFDVDRPLRPCGRLVNRLLLTAIRRSAYVQDALKNINTWENINT